MAITTAMSTSAKVELLSGGHCFFPTITATVTTTSGQPTLTSVSSMAGVAVGMAISGTGIPAGTVVAKITSTSAITMSANATASAAVTATLTGDTFKMALIKGGFSGVYGAANTNYSDITGASDEASGAGYTAGGVALTNASGHPTSASGVAYVNFSPNPSWTSASFTAAGCMVYNAGTGGNGRVNGQVNQCVAVYDFGGAQTVTSGTFSVLLPSDTSSLAVIRLQ